MVGGAAADFKGGGEFDGFDRAKAFDAEGKEGFRCGTVETRKAVEFGNDFLGEFDDVFALGAGAEENGDKGCVGDGGDAAALDFLARTEGIGELADGGIHNEQLTMNNQPGGVDWGGRGESARV